jgi:hypothetical protein
MLMVELFTISNHKTRYIPTSNVDRHANTYGRMLLYPQSERTSGWMWKELWMQVYFLYTLEKLVLTSKTHLESVISLKTNNYCMLLYVKHIWMVVGIKSIFPYCFPFYMEQIEGISTQGGHSIVKLNTTCEQSLLPLYYMGASTVKWTTLDPCSGLSESDPKIYTNFDRNEIEIHENLESI